MELTYSKNIYLSKNYIFYCPVSLKSDFLVCVGGGGFVVLYFIFGGGGFVGFLTLFVSTLFRAKLSIIF